MVDTMMTIKPKTPRIPTFRPPETPSKAESHLSIHGEQGDKGPMVKKGGPLLTDKRRNPKS